MALYIALASIETLAMVVVVVGAYRCWARLEPGARLVVAGVAVFLGFALVAAPVNLLNMRTRLLQELPWLAGTLVVLLGFARWQPDRRQTVALRIGATLFVALWGVAQWYQGIDADFSDVSGPVHSAAITAGAAYSLVTRVQVTQEQWTRQTWFWFCVGLMLVFGTGVVLDPLMSNVFGVRDDLVRLAYYFRLVCGICGYLLMAVGVWMVPSATRSGGTPQLQPAHYSRLDGPR
ncbi:MAG: hypothetical protein ACKVZ0_23745 [Gemmatimonadales bacterium]